MLILLALQPSSCAPPPKPVAPVPAPEPAPAPDVPPEPPITPAEAGVPRASPCQLACARMLELGCVPPQTPGGRSCEQVFCPVPAGWDFACMAGAVSCAELDRCNP